MESKTHQETVQRTVDTHKTGADSNPPSNDAEEVSPHLDEAKHEAGRAADAATHSVSEAGKAAKGSLSKAGEAVVNLVKSHLPRVEHEEESEEERQSKALLDEAMGRGDEPASVNVTGVSGGETVVAEENKPLGGALVDEAQREAAEAREYLMEHVLHHHQDQHPTSAGHNDAQQPTTAERAYHAVVDPMKDAVQSIKDDAAWAYQHTREELFDKSAQETRHEMEPKTGGEWERAHGGVPSSTAEQVLVPPPVRDI